MKRKLLLLVPLLSIVACTPSTSQSSSNPSGTSESITTSSEEVTTSQNESSQTSQSSENESSVSSSFDPSDVSKLDEALKKVGNNYTVSGTDRTDFPFLTKVTENSVYYDLALEIDGYVRLENDNNSFHWYKKVIPEKHQGNPEYWEITGRVPLTEDEFDDKRILDKMVDVSTFTFDGEKYHSDDLETNLNILNLSSHTFSYALGLGTGGVDIYLEDSTIAKIEVLGQGELDIGNNDVFTTMYISDIGTTVNEVIDDFIANGTLPEPTVSDLTQVSVDGKPLYENETHTFDCLISGIYGGSAEQAAVTDLDFISSFFVEDATVLDPWVNYLCPMNITAKIVDSHKGYATLSDIVINSIEVDCYDYDSWTVDASLFEEEFVNFPSLTGTPVTTSLTFVEGSVPEEGEGVVKFKYNDLYQVDIRIAETSEDARWNFIDFIDAGLEAGEVVNFTGLIFHWNNGPEFLLSETASFEKALTPDEIIYNEFGYIVPLPSKADGYDFLWKETYTVNDVNYNGIFAKAFIKDEDVSTFVSSYQAELQAESYILNDVQTDTDGDKIYIFISSDGTSLIYFFNPLKMVYDDGSYYNYTLINIVDLTSPIEADPVE